METVQPVVVTIPQAELRKDYVNITLTDIADPFWHFGLVLARRTQRGPAGTLAPAPGGELISLQQFHRPDLGFDTEVYGQYLSYEIDPADWLDAWAEAQGFAVLARKRLPVVAGDVGDLVVRWETDGRAFLGRLFAMKAGSRLALLWFRAAEEDYARGAEAMFLSLSTFRFQDERMGPLAEKVKWVSTETPVSWRVAVPVSWEVQAEAPKTDMGEVGAFQATLFSAGGNAGAVAAEAAAPTRNMQAKLSFAVIAVQRVAGADAAFETMFAALRAAGGTVATGAIMADEVTAPYLQGWRSVSEGTVNGIAAEVRCRVLRHPKVWVAGLAIAPLRGDSFEVWMRSKRILDVVMATLEIS